jgi:hypothetical protein
MVKKAKDEGRKAKDSSRTELQPSFGLYKTQGSISHAAFFAFRLEPFACFSAPRHIHIAQYNRLLVNIKFVFFRLDQHRIDNGLLQHRHVARIGSDDLF